MLWILKVNRWREGLGRKEQPDLKKRQSEYQPADDSKIWLSACVGEKLEGEVAPRSVRSVRTKLSR